MAKNEIEVALIMQSLLALEWTRKSWNSSWEKKQKQSLDFLENRAKTEINIQWVTVLWVQMACLWDRSVENGWQQGKKKNVPVVLCRRTSLNEVDHTGSPRLAKNIKVRLQWMQAHQKGLLQNHCVVWQIVCTTEPYTKLGVNNLKQLDFF